MICKHFILFSLSLFLTFSGAYAETYNKDYRNGAYGGIISATEKRMEQIAQDEKRRQLIKDVTIDVDRKKSVADITLKKNYPVVPYDPNHPNVKKEAKFRIKANAKVMAKGFGRGIYGAALAEAVVELLGKGVDWVLDPENNRIKFKEPLDGYIFKGHLSQYKSTDIEAVTEVECKYGSSEGRDRSNKTVRGDPKTDVIVYTKCNNGWAHLWVEKTKEDSLSLETIAQHVINNDTVTSNPTSNYAEAVTDTIAEQIRQGKHDTDIKEALKDLLSDKTDTKPEPKDEEEPNTLPDDEEDDTTKTDEKGAFELPEFCDWASWFCEEAEEDEGDEVTVTPIQLQNPADFDKTYVSFGGACPVMSSFSVMGVTLRYDITPLCDFAVKVRDAIIAICYLWAFYVVGNAFRLG